MSYLDRVPTEREHLQAFEQATKNSDPTLTDWTDGSALDSLRGAGAITAAISDQFALDGFRAQHIDTAQGSDLDQYMLDRWGNQADTARKGETEAIGYVFVEPTAGVTPYIIPAGTQFTGLARDGVTQVVAITTEDSNSQDGNEIPIRVTPAGEVGNVPAGTFIAFDTPLAADPDAVVSQPQRTAGGNPAETDEVYRQRGRTFNTAVTKCTTAAVERAVLAVPGVRNVRVARDGTSLAGPVTNIYISDITGGANQALVDAVKAALLNGEHIAASSFANVVAAEIEVLSLTVRLYVSQGTAANEAAQIARDAIINYVNTSPPGSTLYLSTVLAAPRNAYQNILGAEPVGTTATQVSPSQRQNSLRLRPSSLTILVQEVL